MTTATQPMTRGRAWLLATRPKTLPAAFVPVFVGGACAHRQGQFSATTSVACLLCALLLQITSNFANDVFDYEKGADTAQRVGPARAVASGWLPASHMKWAMSISAGLACCVGLYLTFLGGLPFLFLGALAVTCAVAYTGGPYPLGYHGFGDLCVFLFFGLVAVCGTTYLNAGSLSLSAWVSAVAVGALSTAILVVNNVRDLETDLATGKRTLAVRLGRNGGVLEYIALLLLAYAAPLILWVSDTVGALILLPFATLPLAARRVADLYQQRNQALNSTLAATAKLLLLFGLLLTVGLVKR